MTGFISSLLSFCTIFNALCKTKTISPISCLSLFTLDILPANGMSFFINLAISTLPMTLNCSTLPSLRLQPSTNILLKSQATGVMVPLFWLSSPVLFSTYSNIRKGKLRLRMLPITSIGTRKNKGGSSKRR